MEYKRDFKCWQVFLHLANAIIHRDLIQRNEHLCYKCAIRQGFNNYIWWGCMCQRVCNFYCLNAVLRKDALEQQKKTCQLSVEWCLLKRWRNQTPTECLSIKWNMRSIKIYLQTKFHLPNHYMRHTNKGKKYRQNDLMKQGGEREKEKKTVNRILNIGLKSLPFEMLLCRYFFAFFFLLIHTSICANECISHFQPEKWNSV